MGKTTLAVAISAHLAMRSGWAVEFLSCEMSVEEVFSRLLSWDSGVDLKRFHAARRLEADRAARAQADELALADLDRLKVWREALDASRQRYKTSRLRITSQGLPVARDFEHQVKARQLQLEGQGHDPSRLFVVADYLQAFRTGNGKVDSDDFSRVAGVSQRLNAISKDCKVPVWIPFQFGREAEKNFLQLGKVPTFADARGASQIANDANWLGVYHRPWWREIGPRASYVRLVTELSRTGSEERVAHLEVDMARQRFTRWEADAPTEEQLERDARTAANAVQKRRSFN
jgi:replicative DNA helicase